MTRTRTRDRRATARRAVPLTLALLVLLLTAALWREAGSGQPMSAVDEHIHLDTHVRVHQGSFPHRGALMSMAVVREWACGVGHEGGAAMAPCDHPDLGPQSLPSGRYTSGYIHYPTYFVAAEGFRSAATASGGGQSFVDSYRPFAAIMTGLGVLACLLGGWRLGFRGAALAAAALAPAATSSILLYGTIANPQSTAVLMGALIAWSGLRWVLTGRGFWWLAGATSIAAVTAVVQSLPAGVFMVATGLALVLRARGWTVPGPWRPRLWQLGLLTFVVVAPVLLFGRWTSSRATVPNAELYGFAGSTGWEGIVRGVVWELSILHTPWYAGVSLGANEDAPLLQHLFRAAVQGLPDWLTLAVFAPLLVVAVRALVEWRRARPGGDRVVEPLPLLVIASLATLLLYPPALRASNALTVGFDFPIVSRYSISFVPVLVWLLLLSAPERPLLTRLLAVLGTAGTVGVAVAIW